MFSCLVELSRNRNDLVFSYFYGSPYHKFCTEFAKKKTKKKLLRFQNNKLRIMLLRRKLPEQMGRYFFKQLIWMVIRRQFYIFPKFYSYFFSFFFDKIYMCLEMWYAMPMTSCISAYCGGHFYLDR
jgi:hypothetical protein